MKLDVKTFSELPTVASLYKGQKQIHVQGGCNEFWKYERTTGPRATVCGGPGRRYHVDNASGIHHGICTELYSRFDSEDNRRQHSSDWSFDPPVGKPCVSRHGQKVSYTLYNFGGWSA